MPVAAIQPWCHPHPPHMEMCWGVGRCTLSSLFLGEARKQGLSLLSGARQMHCSEQSALLAVTVLFHIFVDPDHDSEEGGG